MDGEAATPIDELDRIDLELLELLGTIGTETRYPEAYGALEQAGLVQFVNAGAGFTWVGQTARGRAYLRRLRR